MEEKSIHNTCRKDLPRSVSVCTDNNMCFTPSTASLSCCLLTSSNDLQREQNWPVSSNFVRRNIPLFSFFSLFLPLSSLKALSKHFHPLLSLCVCITDPLLLQTSCFYSFTGLNILIGVQTFICMYAIVLILCLSVNVH